MDCFQELGFGSIAIKTLEKAEGTIAMRIFPEYFYTNVAV